MKNSGKALQKLRLKVLKFCASNKRRISIVPAQPDGYFRLENGVSSLKSVPAHIIVSLEKEGMIIISKSEIKTTDTGRMHLRRKLSQVDEFQQQHRLNGHRKLVIDNRVETFVSNEGESPLARLRFRRAKNGQPYIDDMAFQAGERLRADFTKGQLTRQLSSNWCIVQNARSASGTRNGIADLSDTALAARKRTEAAFAAVGPEFAGVLIDICCFLKGLELVEKERQWPPRSAKLMLKTGLSILARHYGFTKPQKQKGQAALSVRHWGSDNFKPEMFPE